MPTLGHVARRNLALAMRNEGRTFRQIGEHLGVCASRAAQIVWVAQHWPEIEARRAQRREESRQRRVEKKLARARHNERTGA